MVKCSVRGTATENLIDITTGKVHSYLNKTLMPFL